MKFYVDNQSEFPVRGETIAEIIDHIVQQYLSVKVHLLDAEGNLGTNCWSLKNNDLSRCKSAFILTMAFSGRLFVYQAKNESVIELSWGLEKFESLAILLNGKIDKSLIYESNINLKPHIIP